MLLHLRIHWPDEFLTIALVWHCITGYISPQYHTVYEKCFDTIASESTFDLSKTWIELFLNSMEVYLDDSDNPASSLEEFWLPDFEQQQPLAPTN